MKNQTDPWSHQNASNFQLGKQVETKTLMSNTDSNMQSVKWIRKGFRRAKKSEILQLQLYLELECRAIREQKRELEPSKETQLRRKWSEWRGKCRNKNVYRKVEGKFLVLQETNGHNGPGPHFDFVLSLRACGPSLV